MPDNPQSNNPTGTVSVPAQTVTVPVPPQQISEKQGASAVANLLAARNQAIPAEPVTEIPPAALEQEPLQSEPEEISDQVELSEESRETELPDGSAVAFKLDDGTPVTVNEARQGYLRKEEWTQKSQITAELVKTANERQGLVDQAAYFYADNLQLLLQRLEKTIPSQPDDTLRQTDPARYWDMYNIREVHLRDLEMGKQQLFALYQGHGQIDQAKAREIFVQESEKFLDKVPIWRDKKVAERERGQISDYVRNIGFSDEELANIDHRALIVLRDAAFGARVRANNQKSQQNKITSPTVSSGNTAGINSGFSAKSPVKVSASPKLTIDPNASRRQRELQGAAILASRLNAKRASNA